VREDLVTARRERARLEKFAVRQEKGARSEYRVTSRTGYSYAVVLRSLTERVNSCDCPDFRSNLLGTCKHIEAVLLRLRDRRNRTLRFRPPPKDRAEIYVEYGPEVAGSRREGGQSLVVRWGAAHTLARFGRVAPG
jgi:hypothetical protein